MLEFFTSTTFQTVLSALNSGFLKTLQLFFITLIGALPLGLIISFGSMSRLAPLSRPVHWYLRKNKREPGKIAKLLIAFQPIRLVCRLMVWIIRGTPLVLQIIALFYVPGIQKWFNWPSGETGRMMAVCVAFIINYACYFSEIYRGGIQGVPNGQREAGQVLGMTKAQIFRHITLVQMIKRIVPPMSNEIITLVKDTSLSNFIMVGEIIKLAKDFGNKGMIWPLFYAGAFFLVFNGIVTLALSRTEKKLDYFRV